MRRARPRTGRRARSTRPSTTSIVNARGSRPLVHLVPAQRRRDRRARLRPHRVDRRDRLPLAVLVRVDQHAAALRLRPLGRDEPAVRARERAGDDLRELARLLVRVPPLDRDEHVHARRCRSSSGTPTRPSASSTCLTSSATSITSGKPTSAAGSRSKSTKSGRSGLSTREYHVFRSMQPMFTIQSSASSSLTSGAWIVRRPPRLSRASTTSNARVGIHSGMCFGASFWKKKPPSIRRGSASS